MWEKPDWVTQSCKLVDACMLFLCASERHCVLRNSCFICLHHSVFFYITDKKKYLSGVGSHRLQSEALRGLPVLKFVDLQCPCSGEDSGLRSLHLEKVQRTLVPTLFITGQLEPPALFPSLLCLLTLSFNNWICTAAVCSLQLIDSSLPSSRKTWTWIAPNSSL